MEVKPTASKPSPALSVTIPGQDERIERWDSLIRWHEIRYDRVSGETYEHHQWQVSVRCGSCGMWRRARVYDINPASGSLNAACLRYPRYSYTAFGGFTGLCKKCVVRLAKPNVKYVDGTELFHTERTKDGLPVVCGACKKKGFLKCALSETLHDKHWACPNCGYTLGKWLHKESGATVYWLKRKESQRNYVEFNCAKCGLPFFCKDELPQRPAWVGMCPNCWQKEHPRAAKTTKPLPGFSGGIEYKERYGEGKPKRGRTNKRWGLYVTLPCPLPGCGKENEFHFESTRRKGFLALCKPGKNGHTRDEIARFYMNRDQNGNGHGNGIAEEKRRRGPEPKPADDFINDVYDIIDDLLSSNGEAPLAQATLRIQLRGHDLSEDGIRKRLKRRAKVTWEEAVRLRLKIFSGQVSS